MHFKEVLPSSLLNQSILTGITESKKYKKIASFHGLPSRYLLVQSQ